MDVIDSRRAYRALDPVGVTENVIAELSKAAALAPSCSNNQPWRFVFTTNEPVLSRLKETLSRGNSWALDSDLIIGVFCRVEDDCRLPDGREHYLFDTGMASAFLILRATDLGLVAHPIAGYDHEKAREVLNIPEDMILITLIVVGRHSEEKRAAMSEESRVKEDNRPERKRSEELFFRDVYR